MVKINGAPTMRGTVVHIHHQRGMVAVQTDDGDYTIVELLGDDIEEGDELIWSDDYPLGGAPMRNLTQGTKIEVFFQNHCVSEHQLRQQLLYK